MNIQAIKRNDFQIHFSKIPLHNLYWLTVVEMYVQHWMEIDQVDSILSAAYRPTDIL